MLFKQFFRGVEHHASGIFSADLFDLFGFDGSGFVAKTVAHEGEHGRDFHVVQHAAEGSHRHLTVVFFAVNLERSHQAVKREFDQSLGVLGDPRILS